MAIFLGDRPFDLTPRGQKLLFTVLSTNVVQDGFKFGVVVTDLTTSQQYNFFYVPNFEDGQLYFDLSPLVNLRNYEGINDLHSAATAPATVYTEPDGAGYRGYTVNFTEWWLVGGVLTQNLSVGFTETIYVFNGYYQPSDGYKPDVQAGPTRFVLKDAFSYVWSDRKIDTYVWPLASTYTPNLSGAVYIPAYSMDFGMLMVCAANNLLPTNNANIFEIEFYDGVNPAPIMAGGLLSGFEQIEGVRVYPGNLELNNEGLPIPSDYPEWTHYIVRFKGQDGTTITSRDYVFFNAEKFGLADCRFDIIRLAWVGSRMGWEYQNFTKKSEESYNIERRQYRQVLPNNYISSSRQLTDRQNIVDKVITINSDWLQEGEFEYLKGLLISNQVHIVNNDGTQTPVSVLESNYVAKRERLGKKYNLTLKIGYAQDYWS